MYLEPKYFGNDGWVAGMTCQKEASVTLPQRFFRKKDKGQKPNKNDHSSPRKMAI